MRSSTSSSPTSISNGPSAPPPREGAPTPGERVTATQVDAGSAHAVAELARACGADLVLNACAPRFNRGIFDGAFAAGVHYLDMAMHLSVPHRGAPVQRRRRAARRGTARRLRQLGGPWPVGDRRAWASSPDSPTSWPVTPATTSSPASTRSEFATAPTSSSTATTSPRRSRSGRRSRSASTRPSSTSASAAGSRPPRSASRRCSHFRRESAPCRASTSSTKRSC